MLARCSLCSVLSVLILAPTLMAQTAKPADSAFAGTWFGSFNATAPDGTVHRDTAVLVLTDDGGKLSGAMGSAIDKLSPIRDVQVDGGSLRFHMDAAGGLDFTLKSAEGHLVGSATGSLHATIDVQPAPGLLPHDQLVAEISEADRRAFEAFGGCDVAGYASYLAPDLEFYRDQGGKTGYQHQLDALRQRCGEGITERRELVPGTLVIDAAPGVGAIEAGTHRFYAKQKDGSERLDATARFAEIWSKASGSWKLVRVISYDHQ